MACVRGGCVPCFCTGICGDPWRGVSGRRMAQSTCSHACSDFSGDRLSIQHQRSPDVHAGTRMSARLQAASHNQHHDSNQPPFKLHPVTRVLNSCMTNWYATYVCMCVAAPSGQRAWLDASSQVPLVSI